MHTSVKKTTALKVLLVMVESGFIYLLIWVSCCGHQVMSNSLSIDSNPGLKKHECIRKPYLDDEGSIYGPYAKCDGESDCGELAVSLPYV